jgi:pimeloyl-ACP methyl ester carboxylesterase
MMRQERVLSDADGASKVAIDQFFTSKRSPPAPRDVDLIARGTRLTPVSGLAATAWGDVDHPTVRLAHGWNSRGTHWVSFIDALTSAGFRAVALDAPAHGDSPGTRTNAFQYGLALLEVGRALGPLAGIVGHSFGAAAIMIALGRGLDAEKAILISGPASIADLIDRWAVSRGIPGRDRPAFLRGVAEAARVALENFDMTRLARQLKVPALVVHDRLDKDIPVAEAEAIAAAWPGLELLITERYGHSRILIAREVVREALRFLFLQDE